MRTRRPAPSMLYSNREFTVSSAMARVENSDAACAASPSGNQQGNYKAINARGAPVIASVLDDRRRFFDWRSRRYRRRIDRCGGQWLGCTLERELKHLLDPAHRMNLQPILDLVGNL